MERVDGRATVGSKVRNEGEVERVEGGWGGDKKKRKRK